MSHRFKAYVVVIFTCFIWGISFLSSQEMMLVLHPMTLAFLRFVIASMAFLVSSIISKHGRTQNPNLKIDKKDYPKLILGGIIGISLYYLFENYGVFYTNASIASIITATIPIFSMLSNRLIHKKKLSTKNVVSTFFSFFGVALIVFTSFSVSDVHWIGFVFMSLTVVCWISFNYIARPLSIKYSSLAVTKIQTYFATIFLFPSIFIYPPDFSTFEWAHLGHLIFLGVFCSAMGYLFYLYALKTLDIVLTTIFINCIPLVTVAVGFLFFNQQLSILQLIGGAIILCSVMYCTK